MSLRIISVFVLTAAVVTGPIASMAKTQWDQMDVWERMAYIDELIVKYEGKKIDIPERHCSKKDLHDDVERACEIKMWSCLGTAGAVHEQGMLAILAKWQRADEVGKKICNTWCLFEFKRPRARQSCRVGCNPACTELGEYKDEILQLIGDISED